MSKPVLNVQQSLKKLASIPELKDEKALTVVSDAINNKIVALGTDEAFALRDKEGEIRAFRQQLTLSIENKTLVQIPGTDAICVSAQGYEVWAEAAGATVIFPDTVTVGGSAMPNPYPIMDKSNGRIKAVYARAVAFRYSSKGIPQVADWSTVFDTTLYRMIDLIAKANKFPQAFKLLPKDMKPDEDGTWGSYVFDEAMMLWVNSAHKEALQWYKQIINREKKSMDFAQTFARRNAFKHLSGIQKAKSPEWTFQVLCWRPTSGNIIKWDATTYAQLKKRVGKLVHTADTEFKSKEIEYSSGTEDMADEGVEVIEAEVSAEQDETDQGQSSGSGETKQAGSDKQAKSEHSEEDDKILHSLQIMMDDNEYYPIYVEAVARLNLIKDAKHSPEDARKILKKIEQIIDNYNR